MMKMAASEHDAFKLREQAEQQLAAQATLDLKGKVDKERLLHELQLYQIELEMQNESLRESQVALEDSHERYIHECLGKLEQSRRLIAIQEQERRRLALDLHDIVSPNLAAIKINLGIIHVRLPNHILKEVSARLEDTYTLLNDTIHSLREFGNNLRPVVLDYAGLYAALESYIEQFTARTGIAAEIGGMTDADRTIRLPSDLESSLFRIAQEALTNSAKHANPKAIVIRLSHDAEHGSMTISDDGTGFNPEAIGKDKSSPGLGLLTMVERAEFIGGVCRIESGPGVGTTITVKF